MNNNIRSPKDFQIDHVALTYYYWGGPQKMALSQDWLSGWIIAGVVVNSLSKTIQDTITVTHGSE